MDWYTRKEVADILGVSTATVYQYAKNDKIKKIDDPHRLYREARYQKKEVDALAEELSKQQPDGIRPSQLAKQLKIPVKKIYSIIKEHNLQVDEFPIGDTRIGYSISKPVAATIEKIASESMPTRGTPTEFYNSQEDIALFQKFVAKNGQEIRVVKNERQEWGFYMQGRTWLPFKQAMDQYHLTATYPIHRKNIRPVGYTDFILPKNSFSTFDFIDFVYEEWGIENVRLRELEDSVTLSIKSGGRRLATTIPDSLTENWVASCVSCGEVVQSEGLWNLISGYRKTSVQLPDCTLKEVNRLARQRGMTMSEFIEEAVHEKLKKT